MCDVQEELRRTLKNHPLETPVNDETLHLVRLSLQGHYDRARKEGVGIEAVFIRLNPRYKNREFWLRRVDGTEESFSYRKCFGTLSNRAPKLSARLQAACREAVELQILAFREAHEAEVEEIKTRGEEAQVDHVLQFKDLVIDFMRENKLQLADVKFTERQGMWQFADKELRRQFAEFHRAHAKLRILTAEENAARPKSIQLLEERAKKRKSDSLHKVTLFKKPKIPRPGVQLQ
jgi:hypothetical protein